MFFHSSSCSLKCTDDNHGQSQQALSAILPMGLRGTIVKPFLQAFHQTQLLQSVKLTEDEQWNSAEVATTTILPHLPPPYSHYHCGTQQAAWADSARQMKHLRIEECSYFAVPMPLSCSLANQDIKMRIRKDIRARLHPITGTRHDTHAEGGFSSTFGLMSLDDPNMLAGLAGDGTPFFSGIPTYSPVNGTHLNVMSMATPMQDAVAQVKGAAGCEAHETRKMREF
ncbi:hypothetical protein A0H81_01824 [Grifola frondosa]|uniref:Uncharacterized protein n=1 Tax=Grifola frondosa TaxID=5627 RepID=A0A1C7MLZ4_GRIFR|nr:hypothetical protein A0H81_01824 [Grifola frondosa]